MLISLTHSCILLTIVAVFPPALQRSMKTKRGEPFSLAQTKIRREASADDIHYLADASPADEVALNRGVDLYAPSLSPNGLSTCESEDDQPKTRRGKALSPEQMKTRREASNDAIHFPAEASPADEVTLDRGGVSKDIAVPSPCPNGLSFCESKDDYPKDLIKEMLKKQPKLLLDHIYIEPDSEDVANKFDSSDASETPLCVSMKTTVYPTTAETGEGLSYFVVNQDEYRQGVRIESCMSNGRECTIPGALANGYTSRCVQRHIVRTLVVLNRNSSDVEGFVTKPFEFPSCCSCVVSMNANRFGHPLFRSGSADNSTTPAVPYSTVNPPSKPINTKS